jgi:geranylgeranylglycerol-phosphate geranylgeranyltransferase
MLKTKIKGAIRLIRPELPFAAGICVVLGEIVTLGGFPSLRQAVLGFLCGFFISGSAIVLNDYFDLEVDRVNTPTRPLAAGIISPAEAIWLTIITAFMGLAASAVISLPAFILCGLFWVLGTLYNWKLKEAGLLGNLMVSSSVGITFILGGMAVGQPWNGIVWSFALMAFFIDLGEEMAGDAMDIEGDKKRNSKSIAIVRGKKFALTVSGVIFGLAILISLVPVVLGWMGITYFLLIVLTDLLIIVFTVRLLKSKTHESGRKSMRGIYLGAMIGVFAAILGQIFR